MGFKGVTPDSFACQSLQDKETTFTAKGDSVIIMQSPCRKFGHRSPLWVNRVGLLVGGSIGAGRPVVGGRVSVGSHLTGSD